MEKRRSQLPQDMRLLLDEHDDNMQFLETVATAALLVILILIGCFS